MGKGNFRFIAPSGNVKDNIGPRPLGFVLNKVKVVVQNMLDDFLARHEFDDVECATVNVLVVVLKLSTELVGVTLNGL